jgi:hypothetical protein
MKRATFYLSVLLLGVFLAFVSGCSTTPEETCEQDEICTGKTVTACCTEAECYYEYNGVKYGTDAQSMTSLAVALGCTQASALTYKEDISDIILRLEALGEIAKTNQLSLVK